MPKYEIECEEFPGYRPIAFRRPTNGDFIYPFADPKHMVLFDPACHENSDRLIFEPVPTERRVGWINVYSPCGADVVYISQDEADESATSARIACVRIEYEVPCSGL